MHNISTSNGITSFRLTSLGVETCVQMQRPEMRLPWRRGVRVSLPPNSKHANASPPRLVHAAFSTDSKEQEAVKRAVQHHNHRVGSDAYIRYAGGEGTRNNAKPSMNRIL